MLSQSLRIATEAGVFWSMWGVLTTAFITARQERVVDWFQFISSIVGSLAWPVAIAIVALIFKLPIERLLPRITNFELWGSKATFSSELQKAEETAEKLPSVVEHARPESAAKPDDPYFELAERFPEAAVMDSFKMVEAVFHEYAEELGVQQPANNRVILRLLMEEGFVSRDVYNLYGRVSDTRNAAVHADTRVISAGEAIAYRDLCEQLTKHLRKALKARTKAKNAALKAGSKPASS
jgi:hypothetical protein